MSYKVVRRLTGGGFAEVFEVEDTESALPEHLILKRLSTEMSARADVRAAFAEEAKYLRELKHPNVVTFRRCYFDEAQRVCLLMEKVGGEPLDAWARRYLSQPQTVLDAFERVVQAVDYLHRRAVPFLHLDLKPDNILVSSSDTGPQPVLIDFGIARRSGGKGLKAYTPPYGAPEQESGSVLNPTTDVHALGQILSELLDALPVLPEAVRQSLREVAARAKSPAQRSRFEDAGGMGLAFRRARKAVASSPSLSRSRGDRPPMPRWGYAVGATVFGILMLLGVVWLARPEPSARSSATSIQRPNLQECELLVKQARNEISQGEVEKAKASYGKADVLCRPMPTSGPEAERMEHELASLQQEIELANQGFLRNEGTRLDGQ